MAGAIPARHGPTGHDQLLRLGRDIVGPCSIRPCCPIFAPEPWVSDGGFGGVQLALTLEDFVSFLSWARDGTLHWRRLLCFRGAGS